MYIIEIDDNLHRLFAPVFLVVLLGMQKPIIAYQVNSKMIRPYDIYL